MSYTQEHRKALIVGLGKTGISAVRHLVARGWQVAVTDSRTEPPGREELSTLAPTTKCSFGRLDASLLKDSQIVVASPGIALSEPVISEALSKGIDVVSDVELFAREAKAPVVGITGTNGKSTVTTLVGRMATRAGRAVSVGGNLGTPVLYLLEALVPQLYVLELSSFQLETTCSLRLLAATVLNLSEDHLDRHSTMDAYAAAKARIFRHCDTAVINRDDAYVKGMSSGAAQKVVDFSIGGTIGAEYSLMEQGGERWLAVRGRPVLALSAMRLTGLHNAANALAALALGEACGLPLPPMLDELCEFAGLPHRSQWVGEKRGVRYINDSKGTNVGATVSTISGMCGTLLLIAGGEGKGQDFAPLATALAGRARVVLLIGRDAPQLAKVLEGICEIVGCASIEEAVDTAASRAKAGEIVLLSPACASLDMFRDYTERGDRFVTAVGRLPS